MQESVPTFVFSHGLESRGSAIVPADAASQTGVERLRRLVTAPLWRRRARSCDRGFRHATAALLINQEDAAFAASHHGVTRERRMVFRNGVSTVAGDTSLPTAERCRVLFIGTWERRKGVETLCKAASLLAARRIDVSWHLAGTGVSEEAVRAAWPRELAAATRVTPKFPAAEEAAMFRESSLFVLPSFFEGQPLSLLQAMAWGRCCVVADGCGQRDLIVPRRNGLLHAPGDAEALAALLAECVADSKLRAQLGANARASVHGRTWETVSDEVVSFVEALAGA